ncbi:MAG TPA: DUF6308 family protein, partial [Chthonomonadaceae bacterium]|nr:DUF6308 family protein [Chthonomonadaceae bacterium]
RAYYCQMAGVPWITDMAASKMLHLKRPLLVAISDSYVRDALGNVEPDPRRFPWKAPYCAERALLVTDAVRHVGLRNRDLIDSLHIETAEHCISRVRLIDILIWVDGALRNGHHKWIDVATKGEWSSVGPPRCDCAAI